MEPQEIDEDFKLNPENKQKIRNQCLSIMKSYLDTKGYLSLDLFVENKELANLAHQIDEGPMSLINIFVSVHSEYDFSI
ncbi:hypothetical protein GW764_03160 [Candidatus Parcubacteria bacterium]|nr:hypothetical protein [Candidatus Parcubacteria bacterium]